MLKRMMLGALALSLAASAQAQQGQTGRPASIMALQVGGRDPANALQAFKVDANGAQLVASTASPTAGASASITPVVTSGAASLVGKASAGNLYGVEVTSAATAGYLYVFNATAAPADGAVTAGTASGNYQHCQAIAATSTVPRSWEVPDRYSVGIVAVFSSTACGTLTKSATPVFLKVRAQ